MTSVSRVSSSVLVWLPEIRGCPWQRNVTVAAARGRFGAAITLEATGPAASVPPSHRANTGGSLGVVTELTAQSILTNAGSTDRTFARNDLRTSAVLERFVGGLTDSLQHAGYTQLDAPGPSTNVVLHSIDADAPRPYRRKAAPTFVIAIAELDTIPEDRVELLRVGYPLLVRALANLCVMVSDGADGLVVRFVTLEQGVYGVGPGLADDDLAAPRVRPHRTARGVATRDRQRLRHRSSRAPPERRRADRADAPRRDARSTRSTSCPRRSRSRRYSDRAISVTSSCSTASAASRTATSSARYLGDELHGVPDPDGPVYWMSASGVDKADLRLLGEHILLVRGFDPERETMVLSVPPDVKARRVSVDAIEHWMIYREHPDVGAILHVHGWIDGTVSTDVNFPCGTLQLAASVADLVRRAPDPSRAVVGLRNHGLTITGHSLDDIFDRFGAAIVPRVPME